MDHNEERKNRYTPANEHASSAAPENHRPIQGAQVGASRTQSSPESTHDALEYEAAKGQGPYAGSDRSPPRTDTTPSTYHVPRHRTDHPPSNSALEPPVTKATLSELDVNKIVHNPKLRHDINFDPDLHFRPNLDGDKGRRKAQKANDFWDTMRRQLQGYMMQREQFEAEIGGAQWCLPTSLRAIRDILETLVPARDRSSVEETFNVNLLMQQFQKRVADLGKLALWLSQLLKCHCAPMRDAWVDEMVSQLSNGDRNGDVSLLVAGMQNLLAVLEAMKLVSMSRTPFCICLISCTRMWPIIRFAAYDLSL